MGRRLRVNSYREYLPLYGLFAYLFRKKKTKLLKRRPEIMVVFPGYALESKDKSWILLT